MNDRDPIRERLQRLPTGTEADSVLADLRPAMRRARTTRRLGAAGLSLLVLLAGIGGARALSDGGSDADRITVTTTPTPGPEVTPDPSPPAPTPAPTPTPRPNPSPSPSPAAAAEPTIEVFRARDAATITVAVSDILVIQDVQHTDGWSWSTRRAEPDDIELEFVNGDLRVRWRLRLIDGVAVPEVDSSGPRSGSSGSSSGSGSGSGGDDDPDDPDNSGPGNADDRDRDDRDERDNSGPGNAEDRRN